MGLVVTVAVPRVGGGAILVVGTFALRRPRPTGTEQGSLGDVVAAWGASPRGAVGEPTSSSGRFARSGVSGWIGERVRRGVQIQP